ncbi:MAG: rRNA pseudouridine synthase [Chloroflexi bacterium]|nr:rRNA pseudouridine synthase [Chloroflexota bacterium]MBP8056384.1 rRNA pseudouridine synthase [Chloroflexota bacterium]
MPERLQKLLSQAGFGSRRTCEELIRAGVVQVNGQVATLGTKADLSNDKITVRGRTIQPEKRLYIMLYKPKGVLSSTEDELDEGRQTVRDLVDVPGHLYPVGRLDKQSEGLILLTNDGTLANRLTHPRYEHEKEYKVLVNGQPAAATLSQWRQGVLLDDQMTAPAVVQVEKSHLEATWLTVILKEGKKRQIRRVAAALGHEVRQLIRVRIGPLVLSGVNPGQWRYLTPHEVQALEQTTR